MSSEPERDELSGMIADLEEEKVLAMVRERMARGADPLEILESCRRGMRVVGHRYETGAYFISGLIIAGEIMREIGKLVLPLLAGRFDRSDSGTILLGTVAGDIHFIGKDVFKVLARCHGFQVFDIGVNAPPAEFLTAARKTRPRIVGLSCLLSPCFEAIRETISLIRREAGDPGPHFIIGGVVDEKVRGYVGADCWATDAMIGVRLCQEMVGLVRTGEQLS